MSSHTSGPFANLSIRSGGMNWSLLTTYLLLEFPYSTLGAGGSVGISRRLVVRSGNC